MNAAINQPSILTLRLGQSDQAGHVATSVMLTRQVTEFNITDFGESWSIKGVFNIDPEVSFLRPILVYRFRNAAEHNLLRCFSQTLHRFGPGFNRSRRLTLSWAVRTVVRTSSELKQSFKGTS